MKLKTLHNRSLSIAPSILRIAGLAALLGGFAFGGVVSAAPVDSDNLNMDQSPPMTKTGHWNDYRAGYYDSRDTMAKRVEARIKTLHDKLHITSAQENEWGDVAQAMRDNEASIGQLIRERHQNASTMSAVDDLQSYETITQAHADGLKNLIPVFYALYDDMSDDQQKNADRVFGRFEGHQAVMSDNTQR